MAQNLIAEHYEKDFYMIFNLKPAQNLVAEHYGRDFDMIFCFVAAKTWLRSTIQDIFYIIFQFKEA